MPAVGAHAVDVAGVPLQPGDSCRPAGRRSRGRGRRRLLVQLAALQPGPVRVGVRREHGRCGAVPARRPGRRIEQHPHAGLGGLARAAAAPRSSGSRASRSASTPHEPGVLEQHERAHRRGGAGDRLVAQEAGAGAPEAGVGKDHPATSSSPSRTGAGRAPVGSAGRAGRRGRPAAARSGRGSPRGPAGARRVRRSRGRRAAPRAGRRGRAARTGGRGAGAAGCRRSRSRDREDVLEPAGDAGAAGGQEAAYLRVAPRRRRRHGVRRRRGPRSRSASSSASVARARRGSRRAGGRRARRRAPAATRALDEAAPGQLVDAEGDVQGHGLLGAGGVGGAGGEVHRQAGLEQDVLDAVGGVHLPPLGALGLEHEDVVGVGVHREALRARRGEVGVGLARVAELELELRDQPGQRRPVAVQALEDDGRAVVERGQRLARVDQPGELLAGERRAAGVRRLRRAPSRPGPAGSTGCGSRST